MSAARDHNIRTERLLLRPPRLDDVAAITELAADRRIAATTLSLPHPYHRHDARAWIEKNKEYRASGRAVGFTITCLETGRLLGVIGLGIDAEHRRAELGYWIGVPHWGQGYATEAARAIDDYGFQTVGLDRIFAQHYAENPASGRVLEKAGFAYEGLLKGHVLKWGVRKDVMTYALMRPGWAGDGST